MLNLTGFSAPPLRKSTSFGLAKATIGYDVHANTYNKGGIDIYSSAQEGLKDMGFNVSRGTEGDGGISFNYNCPNVTDNDCKFNPVFTPELKASMQANAKKAERQAGARMLERHGVKVEYDIKD